MTCTRKYTIPLRHAIFIVQLVSFVISFSPLQLPQLISAILYCLAVFTSPYLMLSYCYAYFENGKAWSLESVPFIAETSFSIIYVGASIYGIRFYSTDSILFSGLLMGYLSVALICTLGYLTYFAERKN